VQYLIIKCTPDLFIELPWLMHYHVIHKPWVSKSSITEEVLQNMHLMGMVIEETL